jgi:hypothetical protein
MGEKAHFRLFGFVATGSILPVSAAPGFDPPPPPMPFLSAAAIATLERARPARSR